jgi:hypothetical protein
MLRTTRVLAIAALAAGIAAAPARAQTPQTFTVFSVTPEQQAFTISPGQTVENVVAIDANTDFEKPVHLAASVVPGGSFGDPDDRGLTVLLDRRQVALEDLHCRRCQQDHPGGCAIVTVVSTAGTQPGTYTVFLGVAGADAISVLVPFTVTVVGGAPPITLSTTRTEVSLAPGGSADVPLFGGGPGVTYSFSVFPAAPGLTVTFSGPGAGGSLNGLDLATSGSGQINVATVAASTDLPSGRYLLRLQGVDPNMGVTSTLPVLIVATAPLPQTYAIQVRGFPVSTFGGSTYDWTGWITFTLPGHGQAPITAGGRVVYALLQPSNEHDTLTLQSGSTISAQSLGDPHLFHLHLVWAQHGDPSNPLTEDYDAVFAADGTIFLQLQVQAQWDPQFSFDAQGTGRPMN